MELWWNIEQKGKPKPSSLSLFTMKLSWNLMGLNLMLRAEKPVLNHLSNVIINE
jgi:hypothetical protein